ncbi:MAG: DNA internalization-related competence protein ComEC/Rec2, partial [Armatimonadetes bacterium]|nr:DNA internalization-related competence protein ComEC/Rec2 [Armatimonadota bacterium]
TAGNPGEFSFRRALRSEAIGAVCWRAPPPVVLGHGGGWRLVRWSDRLRVAFADAIGRTMPGPAAPRFAGLLMGLVFGVRAVGVEPAMADAFRRAGVMHVLVASGTQVSLLLACVYFLSLRLRLPPLVAVVLSVALVVPYTLIAGGQPSIVRAALMGMFVMGALVSGQDSDVPTALAASAGLILLCSPLQLQSLSFQLSYAACIGLFALGLPLAERAPRWVPRRPAQLFCLTLGAQLFVAPLVVWHFRALAPIGLVSNLPVIPVSGVLVVTGLAASLTGSWLAPVACLLNWVSHTILGWMLSFVGWCASLRGGYVQPFAMTPAELAGAALLRGLPRQRRQHWILGGLAFLTVCLGYGVWREATAGLTVAVLDVDEGDSILVTGPTGRRLLVDGGRRYEREGQTVDDGLDRVVPALMLSGVRRLDAVIGTHQHEDHIGGLRTVLQAYQPRQLLLPDLPRDVPAVAELLEEAGKQKVPVGRLARGQTLDLGGGARAYVLWPPLTPVRGTGSDENNNAVVLKVVFRRVSFLLASDLEEEGERLLTQMPGDLSATVLKVPHQGSADASSAEFLAAVRPAYAVVTVGPNNFGHPSPATLARLRVTGARIHRTDHDGMVVYRTDGHTVSVHTFGRR